LTYESKGNYIRKDGRARCGKQSLTEEVIEEEEESVTLAVLLPVAVPEALWLDMAM
jgi:hypothetical protein